MKDIAIFGAGGLGREIASMIDLINQKEPVWNLVGFYDDDPAQAEKLSDKYGGLLGGTDELNSVDSPLAVVICVGNPRTRKLISGNITNPHIYFPNLVSPDFVAEDPESFSMGRGNIIKSHCRVTVNVSIGDFNVLNGTVTLGHDARMGDCNVLMPGVRISGETIIGDCNLFGSGSFVKQGLRVGNEVTLSPLSPLMTRPKDGCTYMGNPAKIFKF